MSFIALDETNWKYILIVFILALIVGLEILLFYNAVMKEMEKSLTVLESASSSTEIKK